MKTVLASIIAVTLWFAAGVAGAAEVASRPLDGDSFAKIRARYEGKPLIVHIWGMTCAPCLTELPRWGAFQRAHPEVNLVLIQADRSSSEASAARLRSAGLARTEHWAVTNEPDEYLRASIDPRWSGDMPRTLLFPARGDVVRIRGEADQADVSRWVKANGGAGK